MLHCLDEAINGIAGTHCTGATRVKNDIGRVPVKIDTFSKSRQHCMLHRENCCGSLRFGLCSPVRDQ